MEFRIDRGTLADAIAWAARSLPTRSPVPVLGGLLLDAREGRLRISGFDYETSARIDVGAEVTDSGTVLVLGRRLLDICRVLAEAPVSCSLDGSRFTVEGGGTRFGLSVLPRDEYPALPELPPLYGEVDAAAFAEAVGQVVVAAGKDESLPVLTGVQLRLDGKELTLAATDRYRFAVRTLTWSPQGPDTEPVDLVVPGRRLHETVRGLAKSGAGIRIGLAEGGSGGLISFEGAGTRTTLRLLDGRLPRYDKLFALTEPTVAVADREPFAEAVRRVSVVAEPGSPVRLDFSPEGTVLLQAGYEDDTASQRLPAELTGGTEDGISVAFNHAYLTDALNSFTGPRLTFELLGPGQRAILSDGLAGTPHRHLLMSVRQLS